MLKEPTSKNRLIAVLALHDGGFPIQRPEGARSPIGTRVV